MRTRSHALATAGGVLSLAVVLTACGGGNGSTGELSYEDSPLSTIFEGLDSMSDMSQEEMQAHYDAQNRRTEELTAQCMAEQGFDYTPQENGGTVYFSSEEQQLDPLEWAQQYGYGVFTWEEQNEAMGMSSEETEWVDANQHLYDTMSESELQAWNEALWGPPQDWDEDADMAEWEYNWEDAGCQGWAQHEVEQEDPNAALYAIWEDPRFSELFEELNNLYTTTMDSPDTAAINAEWSSCMSEAGYTFAAPDEAMNSIYTLQEEFYNSYNSGSEEWVEPPAADLAPLKEQEIATAVADVTCRNEVDYDQRQMKISFAVEQEFVDQHQAEIEELRAAVAEAKG